MSWRSLFFGKQSERERVGGLGCVRASFLFFPSDKCLDCLSGATSGPPRREDLECRGSDSSSNSSCHQLGTQTAKKKASSPPRSGWTKLREEENKTRMVRNNCSENHRTPAVLAMAALPAITTRRLDIDVIKPL